MGKIHGLIDTRYVSQHSTANGQFGLVTIGQETIRIPRKSFEPSEYRNVLHLWSSVDDELNNDLHMCHKAPSIKRAPLPQTARLARFIISVSVSQ